MTQNNQGGSIRLFNKDGTPANDVIQFVQTTNGVPSPGGGFISPDVDVSGTVTTVSVTTAHGLAGTVTNPTTTPAITLSTTVTGLVKGDGTSLSAAVAGTDYLTPTGNGSGLTALTAANISAGTAAISVTGNSGTATALQTARTIAGHSFDGTANISIAASDVGAVPTTTTVNGNALSSNVTVTDANLSTSDVTTNNVSITKHGFAPKAPNDATKFLDGTGNYSVPAGGGSITYIADNAGGTATASGTSSLAVGSSTTASNSNAIAVGDSATASATNTISIGQNSTATANYSTSLGRNAHSTGAFSTVLGPAASDVGCGSDVVIGFSASDTSGNSNNVIIGTSSAIAASSTHAVAIGASVSGVGANSISIGIATAADNEVNIGNATQSIYLQNNGTLKITAASGVLIQTGTSLTDGSAASIGTLTNAPAAGNPTKWISINDNGITRRIPCW